MQLGKNQKGDDLMSACPEFTAKLDLYKVTVEEIESSNDAEYLLNLFTELNNAVSSIREHLRTREMTMRQRKAFREELNLLTLKAEKARRRCRILEGYDKQ